MGFRLRTREIGRVVVIEAVGRFTLTDGRTQIRDAIHVFSSNGSKKFILVLAQVEYIDSYGIGELARSYTTVRQMGGELKLAAVNEKILDMLRITRLHTFFDIHAREDEALKAFG
jgi:anti-sigma B factor antagonist